MRIILLCSTALLAACSTATPTMDAPVASSAASTPSEESARLTALFEDYDAAQLAISPIAKAHRGIVDEDYEKWGEISDAAAAEEQALDVATLARKSLQPEIRFTLSLRRSSTDRQLSETTGESLTGTQKFSADLVIATGTKFRRFLVLERRQSERVRQVFLPACVTIEGIKHVAVIRDLSESGIGIHCGIDAKPGQKVSVQWGSNPPLDGVVGWLKGDRVGVITECSPIAHSDGSHPRASRFGIGLPAEVHHRGGSHPVELVNLSTKGMSIAHRCHLQFGELVTISLGNQSFPECTVRWSRNGASGLLLKHPLRLEEIRHVLELAQGRWNWDLPKDYKVAS